MKDSKGVTPLTRARGLRDKWPTSISTLSDAPPPLDRFENSRLRLRRLVPWHQLIDALLWSAVLDSMMRVPAGTLIMCGKPTHELPATPRSVGRCHPCRTRPASPHRRA